jgi:hypothetical protein
MRAIFISYRRDDSEGQAGRLYDDLVRQFGDGLVFMDVAAIEPGLDFRKVIDQSVSSCGVLLALIGPAWLDTKDETGRRRLDDALDFVRLETAAALKRDIPVVPVLVAKARMPRAEQLPDDLKELAYRNGVELTHARWDTDVQVLVKALQRHMDSPPPEGAGIRVNADRAQNRAVGKTTAPAETEGAGTLPPKPRPATKSWRIVVVAALAAAAIAAGVGYASYEYRKTSREEAAKVTQAAADAAAKQLAEDQRATADGRAVRKAAADQEAGQKVTADQEAAKRTTARQQSQESQPSILNFAGTWELIDATYRGEHQSAGADAKRLTITQNGSLVKIGSQEAPITREGTVTYKTFHAQDGQNWHIVENEAEAALVDTFTWRLEGPILVWETTFNYKVPYRNHPIGTDLRIMRYRRADQEAAENADKVANKASSQQQLQQSQASIPNFAGVWAEINPKDTAHPLRLKIEQRGSEISLYISYTQVFSNRAFFEAAITQGRATKSMSQGCAPRFQQSGYNYDNPGVNILNVSLHGSTLVYDQDTKWTSPCDGHPIGIQQNTRELQRISR